MADITKLNAKLNVNSLGSKPQALKKTQTPEEADAKVREVANEYEKYFMKEMFKQMRGTVQEGGFLKANNAEKIFQEQLDDQYSTEGNKRGGFGISDLIYKQLTEKFAAQLGLEDKQDHPRGPIPLNQKMHFEEIKSRELKPLDSQKTFLITPEKNVEHKNIPVQSPWAGVLQNKKVLDADQTSYQIKHDNGLESLILTHGAATPETRNLSAGDQIQPGQTLGLAQAGQPLVWTVKKSVSE